MRTLLPLLLAGSLVLTGAACAAPADPVPADPVPVAARDATGTVVSVTPVVTLDRAGVAARLAELGLDPARAVHGVRALRVEYRTVDTAGRGTTASTLAVLPDPAPAAARLVSWHHGTTAGRAETASMDDGPDRTVALALAAAGNVVSAPDYLGLGTGPGRHPYLDHASAAEVSLDALRAVRTLPDLPDLDPAVRAGGFSQGGPVTMALGRLLQDGVEPALRLGGLAPVAGPFDVRGTLDVAADGGVENSTAYLAYLTVAWGWRHDLWTDPAQVFRGEYATSVPAMLDGEHPGREVQSTLPATLEELFTDTWLATLRDPDGPLRAALDEASTTCDWTPTVPVLIYRGTADGDVPPVNADLCAAATGGRAEVVDVGPVDHGDSLPAALPQVLDQFAA